MTRTRALACIALGCATCTPRAPVPAPGPQGTRSDAVTYRVYVANESSDIVSRVVFTPGSQPVVEAQTVVGQMPADIDGPHGLSVSPDGRFWYVSLAHGRPYGKVWKYAAGADTLVGQVELGLFPASLSLSADGVFLFVVNFNLHGDHVPSSVSIVHTPTMAELARPITCTMPHGSRVNAAGTRHYSACMMDDQLVELDTRNFSISARFSVAPGREHALAAAAAPVAQHRISEDVCSPTWAQPGAGAWARFVYVPCNRRDEILEVDTERWRVTRRFATGRAPYNLAVTPAGNLLLGTLKGGQAVVAIDLASGTELARIATSEPVTHGVVVTADARYAFVTNEARGSTRGTVDVIDLSSLQRVGTVRVEQQPGGIDLWPVQRR